MPQPPLAANMCKVSLALPKPLLLVPRVLGGEPLPSMSGLGLRTQGLPDDEIQCGTFACSLARRAP